MLNNLEHVIPSLGASRRKDDDTEVNKMSPVDEKAGASPVDAISLSRKDSLSSGNLSVGDELLDITDLDPVYFAKAHLLSQALAEIGMGKYQVSPMHLHVEQTLIYSCNRNQWGLFVAAGFGWFADSVWPVCLLFLSLRD